jgi:Pyruvate/2-oxoacid:ferredoxin oxidoreductase delta subunit
MIKKSTTNFWKMQGEGAWGIQRVLNMIHGYVYYTLYDHYIACAIFVARTLSRFPRIFFKTVIIDFYGHRYHCKVITYENARKLIAVEEEIVLPTEESKKIIPWEIANKIILKHKEQLAIVDCPCRMEKKTAGKKFCEPIHTCIFYGKVGVDFVTSHMPRMNGHRATKEEILNLLELQQKNGKVFTAWFKDATGYRAGVLCCCCSCCCAAMEVEILSRKKGIQGLAMTAPSGYSVTFDIEMCNLCGKCVRTCQYSAIKIVENDGKERLDYSKDFCMGCGACVSQCPNESISLVVAPDKGAIFDVDSMVELTRKTISSHRL